VRRKKTVLIKALGMGVLVALAGCAGNNAAASPGDNGNGKTLTVWSMQGDLTTAALNAINAEFTKQTGAKVNVQIEQWNGFETKLPTALATSTPPDVIDIGNTQVSSYASSGGLLDLTSDEKTLEQGQTWLSGLLDPAVIKGQLYGVPSFAGDRAVIYNKKIWAAAGVTSAPKTYSELTADLDKIKKANPSSDFSAFYLPAEDWIASMQWVWDAGGTIATQTSNGTWHAAFSSAADQRGLAEFKAFQNEYSTKASRLVDEDTPDQDVIFADGQAGAILDTSGAIATIEQDNPSLPNADIGAFAMPGLSGKTQTVMLAGSDWGIAAKSQNQSLALTWVKIATSPAIENTYIFGKDGWIPNSLQGLSAAEKGLSPRLSGFFEAAKNSAASPAAATWTTIQDDRSIFNFFGEVASGSETPEAAAQSFDAHLNSVLNPQSQ
jgi:N,N'-diacetylchitobiose transport system substrate-binding protein